jgi:hypothetical protein
LKADATNTKFVSAGESWVESCVEDLSTAALEPEVCVDGFALNRRSDPTNVEVLPVVKT